MAKNQPFSLIFASAASNAQYDLKWRCTTQLGDEINPVASRHRERRCCGFIVGFFVPKLSRYKRHLRSYCAFEGAEAENERKRLVLAISRCGGAFDLPY